jgi:catalase
LTFIQLQKPISVWLFIEAKGLLAQQNKATMGSSQPFYTLAEGVPLPRNDTIQQLSTGSGGGYVLLTSTQLLENLAHFSRERIPERTVHAKASAARGFYEVTDDVSDITDADFLNGMGKKTEVLMRISTVGPERGSADTVRDFRGFAVKFKTNEGNQDFVFNNQVRLLMMLSPSPSLYGKAK